MGNLWVPSPVPIGVPRLSSRQAFPGCKLGREWAGLAYTTLNIVGGRAFNLSGLRDKLTQHRSWVPSKHLIMSPSCLLDLFPGTRSICHAVLNRTNPAAQVCPHVPHCPPHGALAGLPVGKGTAAGSWEQRKCPQAQSGSPHTL